ncbi:MAG: STAS domain-containing protein [Mycobacterium sp.]
MSAALKVTSRAVGDGEIEVTVAGELDLSTVGRFEDAIRDAVAKAAPGRNTTLDLRGVDYLDSAAINVLFAHAEGIGTVRVPSLLIRGLTISGLDQIVDVEAAD